MQKETFKNIGITYVKNNPILTQPNLFPCKSLYYWFPFFVVYYPAKRFWRVLATVFPLTHEPFSFLCLFYCISFLSASSFYCISVLSASRLASFFFILFLTRQKMQANPDHSLLLRYRISDVEVSYLITNWRVFSLNLFGLV